MPRHAPNTSADTSAPLSDADDAAGTTVPSPSRGASEIIPAVGNFVSRTVYTTSYAVSYGVVFPVMLIARAVPRENALVHGLVDGAWAARERVFGWDGAGWDDGHEDVDGAEPHDVEADEHDGAAATSGHRRRGRRNRTGRKSSR